MWFKMKSETTEYQRLRQELIPIWIPGRNIDLITEEIDGRLNSLRGLSEHQLSEIKNLIRLTWDIGYADAGYEFAPLPSCESC